jgi:integrase
VAQKLTDRVVKNLPAPERGNKVYYDSETKGFGLRVTAAGARSFVLNYRRKADGLERRYTIGSHPAWSVQGAREKAAELRRHVDGGGDPVGEHAADRAAPTVADLAARFVEEHVVKLAPHTQRDYRTILADDIVPALGRLKVASVEFEHIERLHAKVGTRAKVRANRMLAVASTMFARAVQWKLRPTNPCKGVKRNKEHGRERYLTGVELERLTKVLADYPDQDIADIVRLLLLSGARRGEILALRFDSLAEDGKVWTKPAGSTKSRRKHRVPLSAPAQQILARRRAASDSPWVFPDGRGHHRVDLQFQWRQIRRAAGLEDLRLHDLRHSYASHLVSAGFSLPVIGALLGHSRPQTTARYAHLYDDVTRAATETVGAIVAGNPKAEVLPLEKGRRR